ncbi:MAG: hypothetical protein IPN17_08015 [Deltaproteobacteria bacterium]|nr:hypothetical protein [Deltaproteobacteria bacterium]
MRLAWGFGRPGTKRDGSPMIAIDVRRLDGFDLDAVTVERVDGRSF